MELTRRGEPVAVLIGHRQYARLAAKDRNFIDAYKEFVRRHDLEELAIDPDEVFGNVRDRMPGRDVKL